MREVVRVLGALVALMTGAEDRRRSEQTQKEEYQAEQSGGAMGQRAVYNSGVLEKLRRKKQEERQQWQQQQQ